MVASDDCSGSRQWICLAQHRIGGGNGKFTGGTGLHHIAIVDHAGDLAGSDAIGLADQDIVIVSVIVNDTGTQRGQDG